MDRITDLTAGYLKPLLLPREKNTQKGDYGRVLVIAGSRGMAGAAVLSARAALKAGAGLVTVACPGSEQPVIACAVPEAMTLPLPSREGTASLGAAGEILAFLKDKKYDLCLIGPGLSLKGETPAFILAVLKSIDTPAVVDADALNALSRGNAGQALKPGPARIFTPHAAEASRFFKTSVPVRVELLKKLQSRLGGVCLLKGPGTLITGGRGFLRNTTGGPALAKGGSGDVLAGLIAGLWAQAGRRNGFTGETALQSAALGVYLHGLCGDLAAEALTSRCVLAGELVKFLPAAFRKIRNT
ncbi:MAG: NAD(P)H-hydrate dehydratase [Elusimicrobiales bacterium]|jgi:NAD(P)H-hydrate epimerase